MSHFDIPHLRLGIVPYLNVQPLVYGLSQAFPDLRPTPAFPRDLDRMLSAGDIDLGIAPIFCAFSRAGRAILPAPSIGCDGEVLSVLIVSHRPLESLSKIVRDPHSLTSNALTAVINERCWSGRMELIDLPEGADIPADCARVIIGDRALEEGSQFEHIVDLGQVWRDWTGLPFVFAAWIGPAGLKTGALADLLSDLYETNRYRIEEIAAAYDGELDMPLDSRVRYLTKNIRFEFGLAQRTAIERFHAETVRIGLAPPDAPLQWLD